MVCYEQPSVFYNCLEDNAMTDQYSLIPVRAELNQIINDTKGIED
jgi:hypothetical protein